MTLDRTPDYVVLSGGGSVKDWLDKLTKERER